MSPAKGLPCKRVSMIPAKGYSNSLSCKQCKGKKGEERIAFLFLIPCSRTSILHMEHEKGFFCVQKSTKTPNLLLVKPIRVQLLNQ